MPQMAPMNWLTLFFMFIVIFMIFNSLNYFCFLYFPKMSSFNNKISSINWKW
uniref:ATP synthase complex subunit 8 n=1 Tax=Callicerus obscurus TaxID=877884 RepID=A0A0S2M6X1_9COLE|nr:ATP synthase F0 subunit 8 [Callicerus obscurus]ALO70437.1 ATP synthase F0 subunit 8 [Callicerus obscurus]